MMPLKTIYEQMSENYQSKLSNTECGQDRDRARDAEIVTVQV